MDETTLYSLTDIEDALVQNTLDEVYFALLEKKYNPVNQIVGYLTTGDPSYITSHNNARSKIQSIDRGQLIETIVRKYLEG